ncbi:MAG: hypothetical protein WB421_14080 [Terriglobales bacterium]|jgi:hypothetical protein
MTASRVNLGFDRMAHVRLGCEARSAAIDAAGMMAPHDADRIVDEER